jgi:hypothetical protein
MDGVKEVNDGKMAWEWGKDDVMTRIGYEETRNTRNTSE